MNDLVICSFIILFIGLFNDLRLRVIVALFSIIIIEKIVQKRNRYLVLLLIALFCFASRSLNDNMQIGKIEVVKNNYVIVTNGVKKALIYTSTNDNYQYGDILSLNEGLQMITNASNFETTDYLSYCKGNNIVGYLNSYQTTKIDSSFDLRNVIYQHNIKYGNDWVNDFLFSLNSYDDFTNGYLFTSCGFQVTFLAYIFKRIAGWFFYEDKSSLISLGLISIIGYVFHFPFSFVRTIVRSCCKLFCHNQRNELALEIIILAFIKPYYVCSLSFLLPIGLKIITVFSKQYNYFFNLVYIIFIQIVFNGQCNLVNCLLFKYLTSISGYLYLISLLSCLLPTHLEMVNVIKTILIYNEKIPTVELSGSNSLVFIMMMIILLILYNCYGHSISLFLCLILLLANNYYRLFIPFYTVSYLDVLQGDCCLICEPFSCKGILIDTGGNKSKDIGSDIVIPYLKRMGIKNVDIIISHDDFDHCGSLETLQRDFKVNELINKKQSILHNEKVTIYNLLSETDYDNINDNSLISYFQIHNFGFLSLADISKEVEKDLVKKYPNLNVSVCKLSHHGSNTGSSDELFVGYHFPIALISAGKNNYYNHPSLDVLTKCDLHNSFVLSTKEHGGIKFFVFPHFIIYLTSDKHFGIYLGKVI